MQSFLVLLNNDVLIHIKKDWVENPVAKTISKVFFSNYFDTKANFDKSVEKTFDEMKTACYLGYIHKVFGKLLSIFHVYII